MAKAYMPFYIGDYLADTQHLSTLQHGVYLLLIMVQYTTRRPIENLERAYRTAQAQTPCEREAVELILKEFFIFSESEGGFINSRVKRDLKKQKKTMNKGACNHA
jgi:uncharacterized protein YdaU (DUF1376 family)